MSNNEQKTYSAKPMTATEIQQKNYEKQMQLYQEQMVQYQQQWLQYQQQLIMAQQLSQQYPQYMHSLPTMPVTYYAQQQMPQQTIPCPTQPQLPPKPKAKKPKPKPKPAIVATCTPCDKEFTSKQQYEIHLQSHITCKFCPFEAHYKIIATHQEVSHKNGIKIPSLDTPEEINAWIQERKLKYPNPHVPPTTLDTNKRKYDSSSDEESSEPEKVCKFFAKGKCKKGDKCSFLHVEVIETESKRKNLYQQLLLRDIEAEESPIVDGVNSSVNLANDIKGTPKDNSKEELEEGELDSDEE